MPEKIPVDKDFLFRVLNQVDDLSRQVKELKERPVEAITYDQFCAFYNKMVETNLKALGMIVGHPNNSKPS